ncbi:hypothetical protein BLNAU_19409 [Blattamonas nauphoetae]|uniref:Right handed beta helix domain-containing protein n=1 Tax=Blattamonas nauphoetae TaxID=2049346 RepID=A0ABQ9X1W2_9EUKA|nr:hypothetical protein BLNAU_19409 [Blattamonas nauphoetae]
MRNCPPSRIGAAWRIDLASREIKGCTIDQCSSSSTESAIIFDNIAQGTLTITNTIIGGILTKNTFDICIAEGGNGGGVWAHNDEAIRLENVEFGEEDIEPNWSSGSRDKQQHSSSLVFLANHNAGGPTYASGEILDRARNCPLPFKCRSDQQYHINQANEMDTVTDLGHQKKKQQDQPLSSQQEPMMDVVVKYDDFLSLLNPKPSNCKYSQPDDSVFPSKQNSDNLAQVLDCPFPHQGRVRWQENEDGRKTSSQGGQNSQGVSFKLNFAKATKAHDMSRAYLQQAAQVIRGCGALLRDIYKDDDTAMLMFTEANIIEEDTTVTETMSRVNGGSKLSTIAGHVNTNQVSHFANMLSSILDMVLYSNFFMLRSQYTDTQLESMNVTFMPSTSLITRVFERRATTLGEGLDDVYQEASATNECSTMEFGGIPIIIPSYNEVKVGCTSAM